MIHVFPTNDKKEHVMEGTMCSCNPVLDWSTPECIVIHRAFDGRECFEEIVELLKQKNISK